jgi:outer membrane lipoprotein SlyB
MSQTLSPGAVPAASSRPLWLIGGGIAAAVLSVGAAFALRGGGTPAPAAEPLAQGGSMVTAQAPTGAAAPAAAEATTPAPVPARPVAKPAVVAKPAARPVPEERRAQAPVCVDCGVIESVRTVTRKGEASGVGAVTGGVLGAVLGNQVGKGNGRKVATVLGAVGGGLAGHEVEKRAKSTTVYEVQVRMDDGSLRSVEQAQSPKVGERVQIDGTTLRPLPAART